MRGFCSTPTKLCIHTIGHSTLSADIFVSLLHAHGIRQIADVRLVPASRRHPHFGREALEALLASAAVVYRHFPALGGFRKPAPDSVNTAWRHPAFRGYADYMRTNSFRMSVEALEAFAVVPTAIMCAEAVWWQCHRRLLADTLLVRGVEVRHILSLAEAKLHELSEFARPDGDGLIYPGLL